MGLEKFRTIGDPMGVTDEFVAQNIPERLQILERELQRNVGER